MPVSANLEEKLSLAVPLQALDFRKRHLRGWGMYLNVVGGRQKISNKTSPHPNQGLGFRVTGFGFQGSSVVPFGFVIVLSKG